MGIRATACPHHLLGDGRRWESLCQLPLPPFSHYPALQATSHLLSRLSGSQASKISVFYLPHLFFFHNFFIQCSKLQKTRTIIIFFLHRCSKHMHVHPGPGCHLVATPSGQPVVPLHCDGLVRMIQDGLSPSLLSTWNTSYLVRYTKEEEFNHIEDSWVTLLLKS